MPYKDLEERKAYYQRPDVKERTRAYDRKRYLKRREKVIAYQKEYYRKHYTDPNWRAKFQKRNRNYVLNNKEKRLEYQRRYDKACYHSDTEYRKKRLSSSRNYSLTHPQTMMRLQKKYRDKPTSKQRMKDYGKKNRARLREYGRAYSKTEKFKKQRANYYRSPKGHAIIKLIHENRRSRKENGLILTKEWLALVSQSPICPMCGRFIGCESLTLDHIIPLSKGGKHSIENTQAICRSCNSKKNDFVAPNLLERTDLYDPKYYLAHRKKSDPLPPTPTNDRNLYISSEGFR